MFVIKEGRIIVFLLIGLFSIGFVYTLFYQNAYAHNFIPNDTATFLIQVYQAEIELVLAINNFPSNVTLAIDHAEDAYQIFKNKLEPLSMSNNMHNNTTATAKLEKSLVDIKDLMMNNKETASELMKIVHGQVHPILQAAYNLQLKK
jgi:hypothetical protein